MEDYFNLITSQLTAEEMNILTILARNGVTAVFKAMRRSELLEKSNLSEANFRKTLNKLQATYFVEINTTSKESKIYLTMFGQQAQKNAV